MAYINAINRDVLLIMHKFMKTPKIAQLLKVNQITFLTDNLQLARAASSSPLEEQSLGNQRFNY
jgi:hypothetical protein